MTSDPRLDLAPGPDGYTVSVVMAVRDEAEHIVACLEAILGQDYDRPYDVVVADGRSTDGTRDLIASVESPIPIRVVDNPTGRTAAGLNAAIAACEGDIIVRCDGHAFLPPDYISTAVEILSDPELGPQIGMVGARSVVKGESFVQRGIAAAMSNPMGVGNAKYRYSDEAGFVDTAFLGVFRRKVVEQVGGFDETLIRNQDYELNLRIRKAGYKVYYDPRLAVEYAPRSSYGALASQYFQYGSWKRVVIRRNPESVRARQLAPVALLGALAASPLLGRLDRRLGWLVPGLYATMVAGAATTEMVKRRDPAALGAVLAIPTMHLAWGAGFVLDRERGHA